jgi:hypothetical protein
VAVHARHRRVQDQGVGGRGDHARERVIAASWLLPFRLERDGDAWEVRIRVRPDGWALAVAAISLLVGGILAGHLIAENLACMIGLRSSC